MTYTFTKNNWKFKQELDIGSVFTQYVRENGGTKAEIGEIIKTDRGIGKEYSDENGKSAALSPNQYIIVYSNEYFNTDYFTPEDYYLSSDRKKLVNGHDESLCILTKQ